MTEARAQGSRLAARAALAVCLTACASPPSVPAPASPEAAVRGFLNAVRANSVTTMGDLWGSGRGPASSYMKPEEMEQRLSIIRTYLEHERFELVEAQAPPPAGTDGRRSLSVRLYRRGCTPVVPFTVVPYGGGWLVADIDISAAGNPQRRCPAQ